VLNFADSGGNNVTINFLNAYKFYMQNTVSTRQGLNLFSHILL